MARSQDLLREEVLGKAGAAKYTGKLMFCNDHRIEKSRGEKTVMVEAEQHTKTTQWILEAAVASSSSSLSSRREKSASGYCSMTTSQSVRVEDGRARVALGREVTMLSAPEVEDRDLPGLAVESARTSTGVRLELGLAAEGEVGRLPLLGDRDGGARVVVLIEEVRAREACGVDAAREPEEVVLRVLERGVVGGVGAEAGDDLGASELAS